MIQNHLLDGVYVINILKTEDKLNNALAENTKAYGITSVVVDNRPKANFGAKSDTTKLSCLKRTVFVSNKTEDDTVMVRETPVKISELVEYFRTH